ncbi:hypothetical protein BGP77_09895 [Saccharospirillum sp. MSK14-1]|uniref:succinylglutamate desuccinylase/aspartoacylase family protein n=1 Tax=Saccharospirillum sp. MSK14-1 TaxID=1897632 RepID=UPI000D35429F|nr:succinylglutamate desuccinylase/aspartoacylase family protein [Saccharospirillum sp. MSK14-1]PTY39051.1 hypothetical protein BGP77_09895 [Saccharospirillum sp. MSK14-1]
MHTTRLPLPAPAPGHQRFLTVHEFGQGEHKAYLQAGLHADEWPGLLTIQVLLEKLQRLEAAGQITQRIVIVPYANPVGLNQRLFGKFPGRFDATTGRNFNRGMAIDSDDLIDRLSSQLGSDAAANDRMVRTGLRQLVDEKNADYEIDALHKALLSQSLDATVVLDLHCDDAALPHVFYGDHQTDIGAQLADCLGFPVRLEEDVRGTVAFDGSHTQPWVRVADVLNAPLDRPCFAATVELRGRQDVNENFAQRDAEGLLAFLEKQGFVRNSGAQSQASEMGLPPTTLNVDQVKVVSSNSNGLVVYRRELGEHIRQGDHLADVVQLDGEGPQREAVYAPTDGLLFGRTQSYIVYPGTQLAMIATQERQIKPGTQLTN